LSEIVWLRRELRLHENPALAVALAGGERVVPVFCLDERLLHGRHACAPRTAFLLECLAELDRSLRARGSALVVRRGSPEHELPALARVAGAHTVHHAGDVGPFASRRDERVRRALAAVGVGVRRHPGVFAADDPAAIRASGGGPYTVFTPFSRAWLRAPRREVLAAPRRMPALPEGLDAGELPGLATLGLEAGASRTARGGEREARRLAGRFLSGPLMRYGEERDLLGPHPSSRLSPHLHLGCISPRELEQRASGPAGEAYRRQLCWRDFFAHVLAHFPADARRAHQRRYRGVRWSRSRVAFEAWCAGMTGVPLVDAGMRQLRSEGWMPNRERMVVASFLTAHLGIDWRWGERWFMALLLDGDEASNCGNWQWVAGVGVDPAPPYRRVLSPVRQQERFDPTGAYVRRHVPELARVPDRHLAAPWTMPAAVQERAGCVIGRDYPPPIVDLASARRAALARHADARRLSR